MNQQIKMKNSREDLDRIEKSFQKRIPTRKRKHFNNGNQNVLILLKDGKFNQDHPQELHCYPSPY